MAGPSTQGVLRAALAPALVFLLVLTVYGDLLFATDGTIASSRLGDAVRSFVYLREFGFSEIGAGNLPLWNPHLFSGTPFVGAFQAAVLYPPNWVHLVLPLPTAINFEVLFSVAVLALGAWRWAAGRGLPPGAALVTAVIAAFGATVSLRVLAGALSVLATYAWVPWLLASVDALAHRVRLGWGLVLCLATAMTLLAGHLPTAFMAALALALYCVPAIRGSAEPGRLVGALAGAAVVGTLIAGLQLALGWEVAAESVRRGGTPFAFATSFSLPPESLLTTFVATLLGDGDARSFAYFGRWFFWDDVVFVGVGAVALASIGALATRRAGRGTACTLLILLTLLALGRYTPLYGWLHALVPGFDFFRAPSKFMYFASLFLALLAGMGAARLLEPRPGERAAPHARFAIAFGALGAVAVGLGVWTLRVGGGLRSGWTPVRWLASLGDDGRPTPADLARWSDLAGEGLLVAGATAAGVAILLALCGRWRFAAWGIVLVCIVELTTFARAHRGGVPADLGARTRTGVAAFREAGEHRLLQLGHVSNYAMKDRAYSVWGYDPVVLDRYARFIARTQGSSVDGLDNVAGDPPARHHPLLRLLRLRYTIARADRPGAWRIAEHAGGLPRFLLVPAYVVAPDVEAALDRMEAADFDPRRVAVLEAAPAIEPGGVALEAAVAVRSESTDALEVAVELAAPALLVVTDAYARGWRASALPGSAQREYEVVPANGALRAVPLSAGAHRLRLAYVPASLAPGVAASALGSAVFLAGLGYWGWGHARRRRPAAARDPGGVA